MNCREAQINLMDPSHDVTSLDFFLPRPEPSIPFPSVILGHHHLSSPGVQSHQDEANQEGIKNNHQCKKKFLLDVLDAVFDVLNDNDDDGSLDVFGSHTTEDDKNGSFVSRSAQ
jgi:hypothetical protein